MLLYENDFPIINLFENKVRNETGMNEYFWIVSIDEFESLMELNNTQDFVNVVNNKIITNKTNKPKSIGKVMELNKVGRHYSGYILRYVQQLVDNKATEIINSYDDID